MKPCTVRAAPMPEIYTDEGLFIRETWVTADDASLSIARARVAPGETTRWHVLEGIDERYLIVAGTGLIEIGSEVREYLGPGDLALVIQMANLENDIDVGVLREGLDLLCAHGPALQL